MISVEEAKRILLQHVPAATSGPAVLDEAVGRYLVNDVLAPADHPLFDMSAMDGYAVAGADGPWTIVEALAAGSVLGRALVAGECARIFTGAQVPAGTYAVLQQEQCAAQEGEVRWTGAAIKPGMNIRRQGESVRTGDRLMRQGSVITPEAVGFLSSCGLEDAEVSRAPVVAVIRTGGEFIEEDKPSDGRIFSSNEWMLLAALRQAGCTTEGNALIVDDVEEEIRNALQFAVSGSDVVISTGGVSVGDHDLLRPVLESLGATIHFHGVAQKPGKPMLFATLQGVPVFALPGNPRAVMVLFWEYVLPYLRAMQGARDPWSRSDRLPIEQALQVKGERAEFRAAQVKDGRVRLLADEGSHMLRTLVEADALVFIPADVRALAPGDAVEVHYLPR